MDGNDDDYIAPLAEKEPDEAQDLTKQPPPKQQLNVDPSFSVVYMACLIFPPGFLADLCLISEYGKEIAKRLGATKIGAAKNMASLMNKIATMQVHFPFADIRYTAFFVPSGKSFTGFVAEKAFHVLYTTKLLQGEWYDLDDDMKQKIENKLRTAGCIVHIIDTVKRIKTFDMSGNRGSKGFIYFASFKWDKELYDAIVSFRDTNTIQEWKDVCNDILIPVKVGCTCQLRGGKQDVDMSEYDSDEEEFDTAAVHHTRGKKFVWATSHIAPTEYTAYKCDEMLFEEKLLHNKHRGTPHAERNKETILSYTITHYVLYAIAIE